MTLVTKQKALAIVVVIILFRIFNVYMSLQTSILSYKEVEIQPIIANEAYVDQVNTVVTTDAMSRENDTESLSPTSSFAVDTIYDPVTKCTVTIEEFNAYTLEELTHFSGIGEKTALAIIEFQGINGPFEHFDDLLLVKGIGEKKLNQLINAK